MNTRPTKDEYIPIMERYIQLVTDGNLLDILKQQKDNMIELLQGLTENQGIYRYAEGKWSLKEVVGHIIDVERMSAYRILRIARGDARELSGYDREVFVKNGQFQEIPISEILRDYSAVRQSTITLIGNLHEQDLLRLGEYQGHALSARAAAFGIAGHETHHVNVIRTKYLLQS